MGAGGRGRGGGDWVACATVRLRNSAEILVPGPHGYQDLSNRNDWPVKNAIADLPIRLKGNSKHTSCSSLNPLAAQNNDLGAASQTLLTKVTLLLRRRLESAGGGWGAVDGSDIVASPLNIADYLFH